MLGKVRSAWVFQMSLSAYAYLPFFTINVSRSDKALLGVTRCTTFVYTVSEMDSRLTGLWGCFSYPYISLLLPRKQNLRGNNACLLQTLVRVTQHEQLVVVTVWHDSKLTKDVISKKTISTSEEVRINLSRVLLLFNMVIYFDLF